MPEQDPPRAEASTYHIPVLCDRVVALLMTDPGGVYVDGTVGGGGHAEHLCRRLRDKGSLVCLDADEDALAAAQARLHDCPRARFIQSNFRNLRHVVREHALGPVQGILLDLGVSSHQIDEPGKGFTFRSNAPLDMRFDRHQAFSALHVVNEYDEARLADVLYRFGEERASRALARRIVRARPLATTGELATIVEQTVGTRFLQKSLSRVFQAVRIEVNQELDALRTVLHDAVALLATGGRVAVISYHSLEDRIVKETFRTLAATTIPSGTKLLPDTPIAPALRIVTRHPEEPTDEEVKRNPRSRSAKLRVAEKVGDLPEGSAQHGA